jgi:hypothetical protein
MAAGNEEYMAVRVHDNQRMNAEQPSDNQGEQVDSMIGVLRDLSLEATGGYIGASASISMGRLVSSIDKGREQSGVSRGSNADRQLGPKSLFRADDSNLINASRRRSYACLCWSGGSVAGGIYEAHFNKISHPSHATVTAMACFDGTRYKTYTRKALYI